jgi:hypothetical protein
MPYDNAAMKPMFWWLLCCAVTFGLIIGWVDSRPTWDDTAITVVAVLSVTALLGMVSPRYAWVWALAVAGGIALLNIVLGGNYEALVVVPIAFGGAYGGSLVRTVMRREPG